jgi:hypothetical protein
MTPVDRAEVLAILARATAEYDDIAAWAALNTVELAVRELPDAGAAVAEQIAQEAIRRRDTMTSHLTADATSVAMAMVRGYVLACNGLIEEARRHKGRTP